MPTDLGMRTRCVVTGPPIRQRGFCLGRRGERHLFDKAAIEALEVAVLRRLARCNGMPLDPNAFRPGEDGVADELGTVVGDNHLQFAAFADQPIKLAVHTNTGQ